MSAGRTAIAFFRSPWMAALLSAAGVTLLVLGATALVLPPDLLDRVWPLGDRLLLCSLAALFVVSFVVARLVSSSRSADEDGGRAEAELPAPAAVSPEEPGGNQRALPAASRHLR